MTALQDFSSSPELVKMVLECLVEPYLYHPGGQLDPSTTPAVLAHVLQPLFLVCSSWGSIARRLGVRHLILDLANNSDNFLIASLDTIPIPTAKQLVLFIHRHSLGHAVRSLCLRFRSEAERQEKAVGTGRGVLHYEQLSPDLLHSLLVAIPLLNTLTLSYYDYSQQDKPLQNILQLLLSHQFSFYQHIRTLREEGSSEFTGTGTMMGHGGKGGPLALELASLFPRLATVAGGGKARKTENEHLLLKALASAKKRAPDYGCRVQHAKLEVANMIASEPFEVINYPTVSLLQTSSLTLTTLTLTSNSYLDDISWDKEPSLAGFPSLFPALQSLRLLRDPLHPLAVTWMLQASPALQSFELDMTWPGSELLQDLPLTLTSLSLTFVQFPPTWNATRNEIELQTFHAAAKDLTEVIIKLNNVTTLIVDIEGTHLTESQTVDFLKPIYNLRHQRALKFFTSSCDVFEEPSLDDEEEEETSSDAESSEESLYKGTVVIVRGGTASETLHDGLEQEWFEGEESTDEEPDGGESELEEIELEMRRKLRQALDEALLRG